MNTRPSDIEVNRIRDADRGICIQNCLTQRPRTAVVSVGDSVSREHKIRSRSKTAGASDSWRSGADVVRRIPRATPWESASDVCWTPLLTYLIAGAQALLVLAVVVIVAGWFGGRTRLAVMARGRVTAGLADISGRMSDGRPGPLPTDMQQYSRWIIYALGVLVLVLGDLLSVSSVLWMTALVAGLVPLAQLLSGPGAPATPEVTVNPDFTSADTV